MLCVRKGKFSVKKVKYAFFGLALFGLGCILGFSMWEKCFRRTTFRRVLSEHNTVEIQKNMSVNNRQISVAQTKPGDLRMDKKENFSGRDMRPATERQGRIVLERRELNSETTGPPAVNMLPVTSFYATQFVRPINKKWQSDNIDCLLKPPFHVVDNKNTLFKNLPDKYSAVIWPPTSRQDCGIGSLLYPWIIDTIDNPWMVFVVKSAPHHLVLRNAIRSTWASISSIQNKRLVTIFLVGKAVVGNRTQQLQEALERENSINGDILQCSSAESYKTLPSKVLDSFRWISQMQNTNCFFTFTDDDCVMNIQNINTFFSHLQEEQAINNVYCGFIYDKDGAVIRSTTSKWYISKQWYSKNFYPTYCHGGMYTMKQPLIKSLYCMSEITDKTDFYLEDVLITGILREKIGDGDANIKPVTTRSGMKYEVMYYPWEGNSGRALSKMFRKWKMLNHTLSYYRSKGMIRTKEFLRNSKENTNLRMFWQKNL